MAKANKKVTVIVCLIVVLLVAAIALFVVLNLPKTITVKLNYEGAEDTEVNLGFAERANLPTDISREGYTFGGWYEDEECVKPYNGGMFH